MRRSLRVLVLTTVALTLLAGIAGAQAPGDQISKMEKLFTSPNMATNSDLAFWGDHAFVGYYTGDAGVPAGTGSRGGVRIFDISNPAAPVLLKDLKCDATQNDPIVWDRNGNGIADLMLVAVDRTMASSECGAPRVPSGTTTGWEGVRVFEMSDKRRNPFETIEQVAAVYSDCGAHTITLWPGEVGKGKGKGKANLRGGGKNMGKGKLIVYVSSYPLAPGPTCGQVNGPAAGRSPEHGVIQIIEVPLDDPSKAREIAEAPINYPGDPDNRIEWCERGLCGLEPSARACHDIVVHVAERMAGAACAEQGQVWRIGKGGIPDTANPIMIGDDEFSSGGTGDIPGAVDFFHSVMFSNDGTVVNWVDESFGTGCPTMTNWQARPWHPAATQKTGKMFFSDMETGDFLSEFHVGDVRPSTAAGEYCSAHMGMAVMGIKKDLLVNAWYTGGVDVIDFTDPTDLEEIAFFDPLVNTGTWSAYPYTGPMFRNRPGGGVPVYATDGVTNNLLAQGLVMYKAFIDEPKNRDRVDHLNPQTMD